MLKVTVGGPQPLPVIHSWVMDAATWPLVVVPVTTVLSLVLLAINCLNCRDTGPTSEKMPPLMLERNLRWLFRQ